MYLQKEFRSCHKASSFVISRTRGVIFLDGEVLSIISEQVMADARRSRAYSPEMRDNLEFSGFLQKRRGGFGKYAIAGAAWQERFVTVTKQGLLTYYEGDPYEFHGEEQKEKPRGRIDLRSVNYEFLKDLRSEVICDNYLLRRMYGIASQKPEIMHYF